MSTCLRVARLLGEGLLDLVYPPRCLICERYGEPALCETCARTFSPIPEPTCTICGRPAENNCLTCAKAAEQGGWYFAAARAGAIYEGAMRQALHQFKYRRHEALGLPLGAFLANRCVVDDLLVSEELRKVEAVLPVPLHPAKRRERGFNQAELLAHPLAEMLGVPLLPNALTRSRQTIAQVGRSGGERREAMGREGIFQIKSPNACVGKTVLLVDDVFTTGATINACARALREAGTARVLVVTLAAGG